jgi:tetratricopeptide (TPR) repeat protein
VQKPHCNAALLSGGEIADSRAHLDRAIALYDPTEHRPLATRFDVDARVSVLSYRSRALWLLGYPEAALADTDHALRDAREIGQAGTLMSALASASATYFFCGDYNAGAAVLDELITVANKMGSLNWKVAGIVIQGQLFFLTNKASDAVHMLTTGLAAWRSTGAMLFIPLWLSYLASAHTELRQLDDAWRYIGEAMKTIETSKERVYEPRSIA